MSTSAASQNKTLNDLLRDTLEGQKITIPSIYQTFPNWKVRLHQDYQKARDEALNPWLRKWVVDDATAQKLLSADLGVFAATLASGAASDILCTTARLASLQYFKFTLLGEGDAPDLCVFDTELRNGLQCWDEVGKPTHQVLCDELLRYVGSLNSMDSVFTEDGFPSVERYWERREATAAAYFVIATLQKFSEVQDPLIKDLWKHTSQFVHITNDILSMQKEMRDDQIENLIPIVMLNEKTDCATAMNQSYQFLHNEAMGFYQARVRILERAQRNSETVPKMFMKDA
ncbi:hypothetical protein N7488_009816 [Penicillium malachiteum]|nr:hypothetical protein N7488_009816 [Penicillium malachiteum]